MPEATPDAVVQSQRRMWTVGDYPAVARRLLPIAVETLDALPISAGTRLLDVAAGDGNLAIEAARRGAVVTGIDLTPAQVAHAEARAELEGFEIDFRVGDAQALDVADESFDVVASVLGLMFAPDHERATAEMVRACRRGGAVATVAWSNQGWSAAFQRWAAGILPPPPPGGPRSDEWAEPAEAQRRFERAGLADVRVEVRPFEWHFASVNDAAEFMTTDTGPFVIFTEAAEAVGKASEGRAALVGALEEASTTTAEGSAITVSHPYLLAVGSRPSS